MNIKTFNIGFDFISHDESKYANKVAKIFDTDHTLEDKVGELGLM